MPYALSYLHERHPPAKDLVERCTHLEAPAWEVQTHGQRARTPDNKFEVVATKLQWHIKVEALEPNTNVSALAAWATQSVSGARTVERGCPVRARSGHANTDEIRVAPDSISETVEHFFEKNRI